MRHTNLLKSIRNLIFIVCTFFSVTAISQTLQEFCDMEVNIALRMFSDLSSTAYKSGKLTFKDLHRHYAGDQPDPKAGAVMADVLAMIDDNINTLSQVQIQNLVYKRCGRDYVKVFN